MKISQLVLAAFMMLPFPARAGYQNETFTQMLWEDFKSPVTTSANKTFFSGAALTVFLAVAKDDIGDPLLEDVARERPLGKGKFFDYAGRMIPNALYAGGMWLADEKARAWTMVRASAMAGITTNILKYTIRERRPDSNDREAFPSGHSATVFSFAGVVGCEHHWGWAVPAYALAGLVGFSRMNDNRHQLQDVAAGATIGLAYGLGICKRERAENAGTWFVVPDQGGGLITYNLRY